jgi:hypothetical protein
MSGGNGADRFVLMPGTGSDLVLDFQTSDVVDLSAFGFADANARAGRRPTSRAATRSSTCPARTRSCSPDVNLDHLLASNIAV